MEPESLIKSSIRLNNAKYILYPTYISLSDWKFININTRAVRDLSAADLTQIERIESEDLFRV